MKKLLIFSLLLCTGITIRAAEPTKHRWEINPEGGIGWTITPENIPHDDHIEMSGEQLSTVLRYGVDEKGRFRLERSMVWPMLRTIPNNTHGSLMQRFAFDVPSMLIVNGRTLQHQRVVSMELGGKLTVFSRAGIATDQPEIVEITSLFFPSTTLPALCELYTVKNISADPVTLLIPEERAVYQTDPAKGVDGSYTMVTALQGSGTYTLEPGKDLFFGATVQAYKAAEPEPVIDLMDEMLKRAGYVREVWSHLQLETPDPVINRAFAFAKIRASESIYKTKGGYMHGPGGESYYAAIWANDQAEYVNPFFPYLGYRTGNESAINSYRHFSRFMNDDYRPIPSSIIAEGDDTWHGAGDRGDGAMIVYGAARYALASGDRREAEELWPLIEWCLEYCRRQLNEEGVVRSDSDELENRFPSGEANLYTSSLYYDALISAGYLGESLKKPAAQVKKYRQQAETLRKAIDSYFGATVEGYQTYQYYQGNDILRSWICIPLTVGIHERAAGTVAALLSPRLWSPNGVLTQAGSETFWDRSTLYALMGIYQAGATQQATDYLHHYSATRLLGEHVPYPVEAWPEGSQRHLSAESGLYCRVVIEGLFGIRPTGLHCFRITPRLPDGWHEMALRDIRAYGSTFDISVSRKGGKLELTVTPVGGKAQRKTVTDGQSTTFTVN